MLYAPICVCVSVGLRLECTHRCRFCKNAEAMVGAPGDVRTGREVSRCIYPLNFLPYVYSIYCIQVLEAMAKLVVLYESWETVRKAF